MSTKNSAKGTVQIDIGGGTSGTVSVAQETLDAVMEMADEIWKEIKSSGVAVSDDAGNDKLLKSLQKKHNDFVTSYPIPFRWMVQSREYSPKSFKKFLQKHVKMMYKDRKEFLAAQSEYLKLLYMEKHPRAGQKQRMRYGEFLAKTLKRDDEIFTEAREEAKKEIEDIDRIADEERRQLMVNHLRALARSKKE